MPETTLQPTGESVMGGFGTLMEGARDSIPFLIGCLPFALTCGLMSVQAGLSLGETAAMSGLVYAGTAQFLAVSLIQSGAGAALIIMGVFVVNIRYFIQGLSLSPFFSWLPLRWLLPLGFGLVDETYALSMDRYLRQGTRRGDPLYFVGSTSILFVAWMSGSLAGRILGETIGDPLRWGLDFALPAAFIGIVMGQLTDARAWTVFLVAGGVALVAAGLLPGTGYLALAAVTGSLVGVLLEVRKT